MIRNFVAWLTVIAIVIVVGGIFIVRPAEGSVGSTITGVALIYIIGAMIYRFFMRAGYVVAAALGQNDEQVRSRKLRDAYNMAMLKKLDEVSGHEEDISTL